MQETIWVVMPIYNAQKALKRAVRSVQKQTYAQLRIVLVDDGSADRSPAICDALAAKDARICVVHQKNQGSFAARRTGVQACDAGKRDYICFCDADDRMPPDALEKLHDACSRYDADVSIGNASRIWHGLTFHPSTHEKDLRIDREAFFAKYFCSWYGITLIPVSLWAKLYRAPLLKKAYDAIPRGTTRFFGDDLVVTLHACASADAIAWIADEVYGYRMGGGTSRYQPDMLREFIGLYRYKMEFAEGYTAPQDLRLLADIELCNVAFSFFRTVAAAKSLTPEERRRIVGESVRLPELLAAAQHVLASDYERKAYAQMIEQADIPAIERETAPVGFLRKVVRHVLHK